MPAADFAAAQARLATRRREREAQLRATQLQREAALDVRLAKVPLPFRNLGHAGLSVWDTIRGREGTRPAFRVGQVDAELLDEELLELMKGQVGEGLKYYGAHLQTDYAPEIVLVLRSILFKLTIWDHDASYGASLQGLRYTDARDPSLARPPPTRSQKTLYGLVTVLGRYGWTKWETYLIDKEGGYEEPSPLLRRLSALSNTISTTHGVVALASFLTFLYNGRYRTLLDRFLNMRLVPASSHTTREVSFEYLNRQLVWHAFTEFLLFLLPLVGISRWRRITSRAWRKVMLFFRRTFNPSSSSAHDDDDEDDIKQGELGFLPERTCAICYSDQNPAAGGTGSEAEMLAATAGGGVVGSAQTDITNPYEAMPCGCIYCFVCLAQKIEAEEGEGWTCLRCGEVVKECQAWNGDVLVEDEKDWSRDDAAHKSVGFRDEVRTPDGNRRSRTYSPHHHLDDEHEQDELREVDPQPEDESEDDGDIRSLPKSPPRAIDTSHLGDSAEWARTSEPVTPTTEVTETETETEETESMYEEEEESESDTDSLSRLRR